MKSAPCKVRNDAAPTNFRTAWVLLRLLKFNERLFGFWF
jgi:hypothetical protein